MIFYNNFQKKVRDIIKKIENGNAGKSNIASLCELLENHQNMIPESIEALNNIMIKGDLKAFNSVIYTLNKMSENHIGLEYYSVDVIIGCMRGRKNDLLEYGLFEVLEILSKITQKYPERMRIAVPELLFCLENTNAKSRDISYFMLSIIAAAHYEFFKDHSKELIRALNGLYVDERIFACRLIKQLAQKDQTMVADTYDLIEDLRLNNPDCNLRSEAGFAMDKLKKAARKNSLHVNKVKPMKKPKSIIPVKDKLEISENYFSALKELRSPSKKDLIDILEGMDLRHMIINRKVN